MEIVGGEVGRETWKAPKTRKIVEKFLNIQMIALKMKWTCLYLRLGGEGDLRRRGGDGERRLRPPGDGERLFLKETRHRKTFSKQKLVNNDLINIRKSFGLQICTRCLTLERHPCVASAAKAYGYVSSWPHHFWHLALPLASWAPHLLKRRTLYLKPKRQRTLTTVLLQPPLYGLREKKHQGWG